MAVKTRAQLAAGVQSTDPADQERNIIDSVAIGTQQSAITDAAALTENAGAIGGTNDANLPDISAVSATYTQAEVVAIRDAARECAAQINVLRAKLNSIIAALEAYGIVAT